MAISPTVALPLLHMCALLAGHIFAIKDAVLAIFFWSSSGYYFGCRHKIELATSCSSSVSADTVNDPWRARTYFSTMLMHIESKAVAVLGSSWFMMKLYSSFSDGRVVSSYCETASRNDWQNGWSYAVWSAGVVKCPVLLCKNNRMAEAMKLTASGTTRFASLVYSINRPEHNKIPIVRSYVDNTGVWAVVWAKRRIAGITTWWQRSVTGNICPNVRSRRKTPAVGQALQNPSSSSPSPHRRAQNQSRATACHGRCGEFRSGGSKQLLHFWESRVPYRT